MLKNGPLRWRAKGVSSAQDITDFWHRSSLQIDWNDSSAVSLTISDVPGVIGPMIDVSLYGIEISHEDLVRYLALSTEPNQQKQKSGGRVQKRVAEVARELFPPDGVPPATMTNAEMLKKLGDELQKQKIAASPTTQLRATGRRKN